MIFNELFFCHVLREDTQSLQTIVSENDEEFISYVQLFKSGVIRLTSKFQTIIPSIDKLIENLEEFQSNM